MSISKFTVVIPTMWRYEPFIHFLKDLVRFDPIDEIIIINNAPDRTPYDPVLLNSKIKQFKFGKNIYVNPAWNLGVKFSSNNKICILNDDINFDLKLFYRVDEYIKPETGVIGICPGRPEFNQPEFVNGSINILSWDHQHTFGFGCLMFVHKDSWIDIPEELLIYYGDNWVFDTSLILNKQNYIITDLLFFTPYAQTTSTEGKNFLEKENIHYDRLIHAFRKAQQSNTVFKNEYESACNTHSELQEFMPVIYEYAQQCNHVTELSSKAGAATRAFLHSSADLISYNLRRYSDLDALFNIAKSYGLTKDFIQTNSLSVEITETDLLFLDLGYNYEQIISQIKNNQQKTKKYILIGDTEKFKDFWYPFILEFISNYPNWKIEKIYRNNNGLTVLKNTN